MADLTGMMQAAAGAGGGLLIQDVFSVDLYTGNASTQTITNDLDLSGEGGLVWLKARTSASNPYVFDTERGALQAMYTDTSLASGSVPNTLTAFNSDGFALGSQGDVNGSSISYVSWAFRKAEKFFDIVTYTGTGSARTVAHNLGSTPGCIIVKRTNLGEGWQVYHRSIGATKYLELNAANQEFATPIRWNDTAPTDTEFTVGTHASVNASGSTYIAYLFAHDAGGFGSGSENVISCGGYTGNGSATGPTVTLGYEPQWLMIKRTDSGDAWIILDSTRDVSNPRDKFLRANTSNTEATGNDVDFNATSFQLKTTSASVNANTGTYIYIAIRADM
jgi:hypothetical protein